MNGSGTLDNYTPDVGDPFVSAEGEFYPGGGFFSTVGAVQPLTLFELSGGAANPIPAFKEKVIALKLGTPSPSANYFVEVEFEGNPALTNFYSGIALRAADSGTLDTVVDAEFTGTPNIYYGISSGDTVVGCAQSFLSAGGKLTYAQFMLKRVGDPLDLCVAKLYAHSGTYGSAGSIPTGTALAISVSIFAGDISPDPDLIWFDFTDGFVMEAGTHYYIAIEYTAGDSSNYISFGADTTSSHAGRGAKLNVGGWGSISQDIYFKVWAAAGPSLMIPNYVGGELDLSGNPDGGASIFCNISFNGAMVTSGSPAWEAAPPYGAGNRTWTFRADVSGTTITLSLDGNVVHTEEIAVDLTVAGDSYIILAPQSTAESSAEKIGNSVYLGPAAGFIGVHRNASCLYDGTTPRRFTLEMMFKLDPALNPLADTRKIGLMSALTFDVWLENLVPTMYAATGAGNFTIDVGTPVVYDQWHHLVIVREGATWVFTLDGSNSVTGTSVAVENNLWNAGCMFHFGAANHSESFSFIGCLSQIRATLGVVRDYEFPTAPFPTNSTDDPFWDNVTLLLNLETENDGDSDYVDSSGRGAIVINYAQGLRQKYHPDFGGGLRVLPSPAPWVRTLPHAELNMRGADATLEFFMRVDTAHSVVWPVNWPPIYIGTGPAQGANFALYIDPGDGDTYDFGGSGGGTSYTPVGGIGDGSGVMARLNYDEIYHVAVETHEDGSPTQIYINGYLTHTQDSQLTRAGEEDGAFGYLIFRTQDSQFRYDFSLMQYDIWEVRLTRGILRYGAPFSPPPHESLPEGFSDPLWENVSLLLHFTDLGEEFIDYSPRPKRVYGLAGMNAQLPPGKFGASQFSPIGRENASGSTTSLIVAPRSDLILVGPFTIDAWITLPSVASDMVFYLQLERLLSFVTGQQFIAMGVYSHWENATLPGYTYLQISISSGGTNVNSVKNGVWGVPLSLNAPAIPPGGRHHFAITRNTDDFVQIWIDGRAQFRYGDITLDLNAYPAYIVSNSYLTFGVDDVKSSGFEILMPSLLIGAIDGNYQRLWAGTEDDGHSYRIRFHGHSHYFDTNVEDYTIVWETTFFDNNLIELKVIRHNEAQYTDTWWLSNGVVVLANMADYFMTKAELDVSRPSLYIGFTDSGYGYSLGDTWELNGIEGYVSLVGPSGEILGVVITNYGEGGESWPVNNDLNPTMVEPQIGVGDGALFDIWTNPIMGPGPAAPIREIEIIDGGSGYVVGDTLNVFYGVDITPGTLFTVGAVSSGGVVTRVDVTNPGVGLVNGFNYLLDNVGPQNGAGLYLQVNIYVEEPIPQTVVLSTSDDGVTWVPHYDSHVEVLAGVPTIVAGNAAAKGLANLLNIWDGPRRDESSFEFHTPFSFQFPAHIEDMGANICSDDFGSPTASTFTVCEPEGDFPVDELRMVNGTCAYTGNFTPKAEPYQNPP